MLPWCRSLGAPAATSGDPSPAAPSLPAPTLRQPAVRRAPGEPRPPGSTGLQAGARSRPVQGAVLGARGRQVPRPGATWLARRRDGDTGHSGKEASYVKAAGPATELGCSEPRRARPGQGRSGSRSLGAHGPSRAQPPAWRRSVSPTPSPARSEHGAPTPGSAPMAGEGRRARSPPGTGARREAPRAEAELGGRSAPGSLSPARLRSETPSDPIGRQGQKSYLGAAGRPGAPRRGDPAGAGVLLGGAQETPRGRKPQLRAPPPPFAGGTEAPRSCGGAHAQTLSKGGQPRPGFPPARGRGPPQFSGHLG